MGKSATDRVDDALKCLSATNVVPYQVRRNVVAVAKLFVAAQSGAALDKMSTDLSVGARPSGQAQDVRQMARAVLLLWQAIKWIDPSTAIPYANAAAVPLAKARDIFESTIYKTLATYETHKSGRSDGAKYVFENVLAVNPLHFLENNILTIYGSPRRDATQGDRNVLDFYFGFDAPKNRWKIQATPNPGWHPFRAVSIVATNWAQVPGRTNSPIAGSFAAIDAIEVGGAPVVVTTQFTGCSLCYRLSGAHLYAAHIAPGSPSDTRWPALPGGGSALANQLQGQTGTVAGADFANAPGPAPLIIYGREGSNHPNYPGGYGGTALVQFTMIGFGSAAGWGMYAQELWMGDAITNVRQIYP